MSRHVMPMIIGHRGASAIAPENTIAAFSAAVEANADGVEFDAQLSSDGVAVVYHDRTLRRTSGRRGRLAATDMQSLSALDCGTWFDARFNEERVPTLAQVLAVVRGLRLINIELKGAIGARGDSEALAAAVVSEVRSKGLEERVLLSAFDHRHIAAARRLAPEIARAVLIHPVDFGQPSQSAMAVDASTVVLSRRQLGKERVDDARAHGLRVIVYTVDARRDFTRCLKFDVDGVITNNPDAAREACQELLGMSS